jgi:threonine dehydrogenase-like Zn-dependent dehydrogenase
MFGAGRVIAIDRVPERLEMARTYGKAETIDFAEKPVYETLQEMTAGRGPDRCIDAVGAEAHGGDTFGAIVDRAKAFLHIGTDRPQALRQAIIACRKAGSISVPGVYVGLLDHMPFGAAMNKGLTIKAGQTHMHKYMKPLLEKVEKSEIDPSGIITHRARLSEAPNLYKKFRDKEDGCVKVVMTP